MLRQFKVWSVIGLWGCAHPALAKPPAADPTAAIASMQALVDPIAKMSAGAARTKRACAVVEQLQHAAKGIPAQLPSQSAVDPASWRGEVEVTASATDDLAAACKGPGLKHKDPLGHEHGADQELEGVLQCFAAVVDEARPRAVPAPMKSFDQVLRHAVGDKKHKGGCNDQKAMAKLVSGFEAAPANVDKAKWDDAYATVQQNVGQMKQFYCAGMGDDADQFESSLQNVHESFYKLVLLLPVTAAK